MQTGFLPLPVVDGATLTYERFLLDYALPRQPCIIRNVGSDWPAASKWQTLGYFLDHPGVDLDFEVEAAEGRPSSSREVETTVGEALRRIERTSVEPASVPFYLSAWPY